MTFAEMTEAEIRARLEALQDVVLPILREQQK